MEYRPPLHLGVVAVEKWAFGSSLTKVANFFMSFMTDDNWFHLTTDISP